MMQEEIQKALTVLKDGGVILYPTDTIWGIGCDATNEQAVKKVYEIKQRTESKSLIVLLDEAIKLNKYVKEVPAMAWDLVELTENPLTIIYPGAYNLAKNVINAEDGTVGIRVVHEEFCKQLVRKFNKPLVSTSANISGAPAAISFADIDESIIKSVDYVINLRQHERINAVPSSILKLEINGTFQIIRK